MNHLPSPTAIQALPLYTVQNPLRLLVSGCLAGLPCGIQGLPYGDHQKVRTLMELPNVKAYSICPEDFAFGTPRDLADIHGGNGFDVLEGKAQVLTDKGEDWTEGMIAAAQTMLKFVQNKGIQWAILMDMSAACGSQVISDGCRLVENRKYQKGPGVAAALLMKHGITIISQRDFRTLEYLHHKLDPQHPIDEAMRDHHESEWYRSYFEPS